MKIMKMSALVNIMVQTMETYGDREITVLNEETGEILYVEGMSFDTTGTDVLLETVSYGEKVMIDRLTEIEEEMENLATEQFVLAMQMLGVVCL
jgi:hypothetical protein